MAMFRTRAPRDLAIFIRCNTGFCLIKMVAVLLAADLSHPAIAQEDHSGLTRERYRRNCLMCHSRAAPAGVSQEILAGLYPEPGLRPADVMPSLICLRRCTACWAPDPPAKARPK
jgi:hypothetical protein